MTMHNLEGHSDARRSTYGHQIGRYVGQGRRQRGMAELDCPTCFTLDVLRSKVRTVQRSAVKASHSYHNLSFTAEFYMVTYCCYLG